MPQVRERTSVRRHQIVDAARRVIIERGSEKITIKALAGQVGLSEGAIYRHFNQKQDVLLFLIDDVGENLLNDLKYNGSGRVSYSERLGSVLRRHISAVEQRRGVSFQIIAEIVSLGDAELNKRIAHVLGRYIDRLEALIKEGVGARAFSSDLDPRAAATFVFSTVHGLVNLWRLNDYRFDLKKMFDAMWGMLWAGLTSGIKKAVVPASRAVMS